ncbi:hypothetical protein D3C85_905620 [compost metagenome]
MNRQFGIDRQGDRRSLGCAIRLELLRFVLRNGFVQALSSRELRPWLIVRVGEIESAGQIAAHRAAERADVGLRHAETRLDEAQHRGVIEGLRIHPATTAPWRDHVHGNTLARSEDLAIWWIFVLVGGAGRCRVVVVFEGEIGIAQRGLAGGGAVRIDGRCGRRRVVVEDAVVLVEVDEQHGLAPHLGHGGERIQHFLDVPGAQHRAGGPRMLRVGVGGHDPGHLRQLAVLHVVAEGVQVLVHLGAGHGVGNALVQRVADVVAGWIVDRHRILAGDLLCLRCFVGQAVLLEARERVVAVVVGYVFIHDPFDFGRCCFQAFGVGLPLIAGGRSGRASVVPFVGDRGHAGSGGAVGAGPEEHAVRVGACVHAAVVAVAQGEGVGQGRLIRQLRFLVVAHGKRALVARPLIVATAVPGVLAIGPVVRCLTCAQRVAFGLVQVVGQDRCVRLVDLLPDVASLGQRNREAIAEATHAHQRTEVVVERAVLLHQDDDVLDVLDGAGLVVGRNGQRAADARREGREGEGGRAGGGGAREEFAA